MEEDRKGSVQEYRRKTAAVLERIKDEKMLRRIYIITSTIASMREGDSTVRED